MKTAPTVNEKVRLHNPSDDNWVPVLAEIRAVNPDGLVDVSASWGMVKDAVITGVPIYDCDEVFTPPKYGSYVVRLPVEAQPKLAAEGRIAPVDAIDVAEAVTDAHYHQFPGTTVTVCCLTLWGLWQVVGQSSAADPARFDRAKGEQYAYQDAIRNSGRFLALKRVLAQACKG